MSQENLENNDDVISALSGGNLDEVKALFKSGRMQIENLNQQLDSKGNTALHIAADYNHPEIIKYLLDQGASINATNNAGQTTLHLAAKNFDPKGESSALQELLRNRDANVNAQDNEGNTPLHLAAKNSQEAVACFIIRPENDIIINVNSVNKAGETSLDLAQQFKSAQLEQIKTALATLNFMNYLELPKTGAEAAALQQTARELPFPSVPKDPKVSFAPINDDLAELQRRYDALVADKADTVQALSPKRSTMSEGMEEEPVAKPEPEPALESATGLRGLPQRSWKFIKGKLDTLWNSVKGVVAVVSGLFRRGKREDVDRGSAMSEQGNHAPESKKPQLGERDSLVHVNMASTQEIDVSRDLELSQKTVDAELVINNYRGQSSKAEMEQVLKPLEAVVELIVLKPFLGMDMGKYNDELRRAISNLKTNPLYQQLVKGQAKENVPIVARDIDRLEMLLNKGVFPFKQRTQQQLSEVLGQLREEDGRFMKAYREIDKPIVAQSDENESSRLQK